MNGLKQKRCLRKIRQSEMAEYLQITLRAYRAYENGVRNIPMKVIIQLEDFFDCKLKELL